MERRRRATMTSGSRSCTRRSISGARRSSSQAPGGTSGARARSSSRVPARTSQSTSARTRPRQRPWRTKRALRRQGPRVHGGRLSLRGGGPHGCRDPRGLRGGRRLRQQRRVAPPPVPRGRERLRLAACAGHKPQSRLLPGPAPRPEDEGPAAGPDRAHLGARWVRGQGLPSSRGGGQGRPARLHQGARARGSGVRGDGEHRRPRHGRHDAAARALPGLGPGSQRRHRAGRPARRAARDRVGMPVPRLRGSRRTSPGRLCT